MLNAIRSTSCNYIADFHVLYICDQFLENLCMKLPNLFQAAFKENSITGINQLFYTSYAIFFINTCLRGERTTVLL